MGGFYHLYLDETKYNRDGQTIYGIAGVAITDTHLTEMRREMGELKKTIWSDFPPSRAKSIVLHATDIRGANTRFHEKYDVFERNENIRIVFSRIGDWFSTYDMTVFGAMVNLSRLSEQYQSNHSYYTGDRICLTEIIDNFVCFLKWHKARGKIIFESRSDSSGNKSDQKLRKQFYKIYSQGTNRYSAIELQDSLVGIKFVKKQENDAGLQVADFVPTPFMKNYCGKSQGSPNIWPILKRHRYSGGLTKGLKESRIFGVKFL